MAAIFKQPWPTLLLHLFLIFFCFFISCSPTLSYGQSDSPQNIETFFPNGTLAPTPPPTVTPPVPPSNLPPPARSSSSSDRGKITKAVLITAASTLVVAAAFFFFLQKFVIARRRRDNRVGAENAWTPPVNPPPAGREEFTRFGGHVKGLIMDENGLDVLYWKKLQRDKSESFRKEIVNREIIGEDDGDEKKSEPIHEIPLLRGKSSTSQSAIHLENQDHHQKVKVNSLNAVETSATKSQQPPPPPAPSPPPPPPLPISSKQGTSTPAPAAPPPPPPPVLAKKGPTPAPPPPPLRKTTALASSSSKPPPVPRGQISGEGSSRGNGGNGQVKLKPLHWDKVNPDTDHSMVWHKIDRGSFSFDGDLMEALFGYVAAGKKSGQEDGVKNPNSSPSAQIFILDPRKSQNIAIVLKSLAMSREELVEALKEGHDFIPDTLEKLARIAPTKEEQSAILEFDGDPRNLADAESFLFRLLKSVPSAFTRLNALLFKANYYPEVTHHKQCLKTLDLACKELRSRGLFVKLLEAILKAGNRMNAGTSRGNAQAFNLTALLKLSDVKSVDGKTTLLHFVVEEVVRAEGKRCVMNNRSRSLTRSNSNNGGSSSETNSDMSKEEKEREYLKLGLPVVGGLSSQYSNVKKAAGIDYEALAATCSALTTRAKDVRRVLLQLERDIEEEEGEESGFLKKMRGFLDSAEEEVEVVREEQTQVMEFVKRTTEYYQAGALKDKQPLQLFVITKDFLSMVDKVCVEIARNLQKRRRGSPSSPPTTRNGVKFPVLPANFMSDRSRSDSGGSESDL